MYLKSLSLVNYKNFDIANFDFAPKFNCLVGNNGKGKTNVLDAVYHLAFGKSYFNPVSLQNVKHGTDYFVLEGDFERQKTDEKIVIGLRKGQKKVMKRNGKIYEKFADHIGLLPLVMISPADRDLITEGSEFRRKFMDGVIAQSDKNYLIALIQYHKYLEQRNALLKYFAANRTFDRDTLDIYDAKLTALGHEIFEKRKLFITQFVPIFNKQYAAVSQREEAVSLTYESQLFDGDMQALLQQNLHKDKMVQYTTVGIHKDDLNFAIQEVPIKKFGSQGQQKTFLIALKLAQFHLIAEKSGMPPILLLDDIFDKLDDERVSCLVSLVKEPHFGQIFISDTHPGRTEEIVKNTHQEYKMILL
jgi:DNA replication and repair protein RecF